MERSDRPVIVWDRVSIGDMPNRLALLGTVSLAGPEDRSLRRATQHRRLALLAIIASAPGPAVSRDRLLGLLWPERDERTARHLLADSVYVLRQALGGDAIVASGEMVRLSAAVVWTDVGAFRQAIADARWSDALALYRGDFLDGFFLRNAVEFDQWMLAERNRLRALATGAAAALARALERAGRIQDAIAAAERGLELTPCDEPTLRQVVTLLMAADNHGRAEAVGRAFVERLAFELGVSPSAETRRVLREARALPNAEPIVVVPPRPRERRDRKTDSVTASMLVRARHQWHQRTRASVGRAIDYFTRAGERQARAVDAWCGLADSWAVMGGRGYAPIADAV